ncbi:hypothetical protein ACEUZ9_002845 [Paracoccus litorisediminis]|uniref:hypothetical protein n=1 Tax=Paracoccus litorisediminis TaxID=2006130 RepID=UPI00373099DA
MTELGGWGDASQMGRSAGRPASALRALEIQPARPAAVNVIRSIHPAAYGMADIGDHEMPLPKDAANRIHVEILKSVEGKPRWA